MTQGRIPEPRMRDEFRKQLRARVMNEAVTVLAQRRRERPWLAWLRPAMAVGLAAFVLMAGAGVAAAGSLPGDPAFGLKRAIEDVRVALSFDDVDKLKALSELTDKRLDELQRVADRSDKAPTASEEYAKAVARFRAAVDALRQAAPGDKREAADQVADAAREKHDAVLEDLKDRVPENARESLDRAIEEERRPKKDNPDTDKGQDEKRATPPPTRTREPGLNPTPRPTEQRRETQRRETPRPTATPRASD
jgi:hypothetical protein